MKDKVTINLHNLRDTLKSVAPVMPKSPVTPILNYFYCEVQVMDVKTKAAKTRIRATDLDTHLIASLNCEADHYFAFLLHRYVLKALKFFTEEPITIFCEENKVTLTTKGSTFSFVTQPVTDFPILPTTELKTVAFFRGNDIFGELKRQKAFRGTDELRMSLTGTNVECTKDGIILTSTDANALRTAKLDVSECIECSFILRAKACDILSNVKSEQTEVFRDGIFVNIETDNLTIITRIIDERFPDYQRVIPIDNSIKVTVSKKELTNQIKTAAIFGNIECRVILVIGKSLTISSNDNYDTQTDYSAKIDCEHIGEDISIDFNHHSLQRVLATAPDSVSIEISTNRKAAIIKDSNSTNLIMPIMKRT